MLDESCTHKQPCYSHLGADSTGRQPTWDALLSAALSTEKGCACSASLYAGSTGDVLSYLR